MNLFSSGNMDDIDSDVCVWYYINDICISFLFYIALWTFARKPFIQFMALGLVKTIYCSEHRTSKRKKLSNHTKKFLVIDVSAKRGHAISNVLANQQDDTSSAVLRLIDVSANLQD